MKRLVLVAALALAGCYQEIPDDVPCNGDLSCPTGYYCSSVGTCAPLDKSSPPVLVLDGVANSESGPFGNTVTIPKGGGQVALKISNTGGSEADYPLITLTGPACFDVDGSIGTNLVGIIREGTSTTVHQTAARPTSPCPDATITVEMKLSEGPSNLRFERTWTGSFTAKLGP